MKVALLLVIVAAFAAPSWSSPTSELWSKAVQQAENTAKEIIAAAKVQIGKLLSEGNKEKVQQLIKDATLRIQKVVETIQGLTDRLPGVQEKVKDALAKIRAAVQELRAKAKEALAQENLEKARAMLQEALAKAVEKVKEALKALHTPSQF